MDHDYVRIGPGIPPVHDGQHCRRCAELVEAKLDERPVENGWRAFYGDPLVSDEERGQ